jgi:hypothetical protein
MTSVAASGFTFVSCLYSCCVRVRAGYNRPDHEHNTTVTTTKMVDSFERVKMYGPTNPKFEEGIKLGLEDRGFVVRFRVGKRDLIVPYSQTESGPNLPPTFWVSAILTFVVNRP